MAGIDFEFDLAPEDTPTLVLGKKKKKKKTKADSDAGDAATAETGDSASLGELLSKKKKKKKKPLELSAGADPVAADEEADGASNSPFAALETPTKDRADDSITSTTFSLAESAADDSSSLLLKKKKKKKKSRLDELEEETEKVGVSPSSSYSRAAHASDDDSNPQAREADEGPVSTISTEHAGANGHGTAGDSMDNVDETLVQRLGKKVSRKKGKGKKAASAEVEDEDLDSILAELGDTSGRVSRDKSVSGIQGYDDETATGVDLELSSVASSKKKKNKKKGPAKPQEDEDLDALLAELGEKPKPLSPSVKRSQATQDPVARKEGDDVVAELDADDVGASSAAAAKKKKKKGKAAPKPADDDDLDALLAELEEKPKDLASSSGRADTTAKSEADGNVDAMMAELNDDGDAGASAAGAAKKKKKKGKFPSKPADVDDVDALLAEFDEQAKEVAPNSGGAEAVARKERVEDVDAMMAELNEEEEGGLSAAAAKRKKKKAKKAAAKADDTVGEDVAAAAGSAPKKSGKKESAAVRKLREQQERKAAEEARLEKLRQEEEARRLEEERIEREREEAKERARLAKKEAEKARKARLKAEGKLLSKAEAAKRRKAEAFKQQMIAQGLIPAAAAAGDTSGTSSEQVSGGRVVYSSRKRNRPKPQADVVATSGEKGDVQEEEGLAESVEVPPSREPSRESPVEAESVTVVEAPESAQDQGTYDASEEDVPDEWDAEIGRTENTKEEEQPETDGTASKSLPDSTVVSSGANGREGGMQAAVKFGGEGSGESCEESETESESESDEDLDGMSRAEAAAEKRRENLRKMRLKEAEAARAARTPDDLRSPVICILGHVDTGKTKILDRIRRTNVQDGEAGGITQQIGATYFPIEAVKKETSKIGDGRSIPYNVPSLLIIDTPGHESFTNLRSRGSSLCDIAILVVDIMHGLEPQTRESIDLLKLRRTPFIIALNKIDRMYGWNAQPGNCPVRKSFAEQSSNVMDEFERRLNETKLQLASIGFNTELYWKNDDVRRQISIVPTSAITGEGIPDLLMLLLDLPQRLLVDRLMFNPILEATVLEVKVIEGLGTTIDIVLTGGKIRSGDTIFVVGLEGPIQTTIRALLTPHPMKEMRVKGQYLHHKEIRAAQGIKIAADGLDKAVAGTQLLVARDPNNEDELEYTREEVMKDFSTILQNVDKSGVGVYVQASTLGSLEALLEFLRTSDVPVSGINIGPVHKKDIVKASTMLERHKEYAVVLAFDVPVEREARQLADDIGVTIFTADIIYNLFDMFTEHLEKCKRTRREDLNDDVVFPCVLSILPEHVYRKKSPLVLGVEVSEGILRVGCPLVVKHGNEWLDIGRAVSLELNKKPVTIAKRGESVALKVYSDKTVHIMYGRHFDWNDKLVSKMSRPAINILKDSFREDLTTEDWRLVVKLKSWFEII